MRMGVDVGIEGCNGARRVLNVCVCVCVCVCVFVFVYEPHLEPLKNPYIRVLYTCCMFVLLPLHSSSHPRTGGLPWTYFGWRGTAV